MKSFSWWLGRLTLKRKEKPPTVPTVPRTGKRGVILVDLDGTLAHYEGWQGPQHIGSPVPAMVARVKAWLAEGREVRIFTARVAPEDGDFEDVEKWRKAIEDWCVVHIGQRLAVTCIKTRSAILIYDDRARQVEANTGRVIGEDAA